MSSSRAAEPALIVVDHLNAEKLTWSFEIVTHLLLETEVVVLGRLTVDGVVKMAFGAASVSRDGSGKPGSVSTELTSAANEALSRAARLFGGRLAVEQERAGPPLDTSPTDVVAPDPENRITQKQLGALQSIARRRNFGRSEVAEMLRTRFGRSELIRLTKHEASDLLTELSASNGHVST